MGGRAFANDDGSVGGGGGGGGGDHRNTGGDSDDGSGGATAARGSKGGGSSSNAEVAALRRENATLKESLAELSLENTHQREQVRSRLQARSACPRLLVRTIKQITQFVPPNQRNDPLVLARFLLRRLNG